ncbi:MAG: NADH-quinone oxidoreductase subunit J [Candidatus Omnitrophica bacterium ADurb.Bin277]|nr:MAG: NADH-quinone oxidoreductase subunit J [Candidatus Omnitrophica bacterium ADurb.Bin277]
MEILTLAAKIGAYALMTGVLLFALGVVALRNLFHSALCLAAALIGIAGLYLFFRADFLAAVQILLYVGAVMTVIIFAIMLTEHLSGKTTIQHNRQSLPAFLGIAALVTVIAKVILQTPWPVTQKALGAHTSVEGIGTALMTVYVFPFEVISVVLIAALIGAVIIAKRENPS